MTPTTTRTPDRRRVVLVLYATLDDMPMDCCDDDRVQVWLACPEWCGRRAFVTQGSPVLAANGDDPDQPTAIAVAELIGECFYAEFDYPDFEPEPGERIELENVEKCPPMADVMERLQARMTPVPPRI